MFIHLLLVNWRPWSFLPWQWGFDDVHGELQASLVYPFSMPFLCHPWRDEIVTQKNKKISGRFYVVNFITFISFSNQRDHKNRTSRSLLNVFTQSIDWRKPLVWCIDCSWHSKSWEECVKQPIQIHFRPILCYNLIEDSLWYSKSNSFDKILTKFWMFLVIRTKLIWITNYNKFSP